MCKAFYREAWCHYSAHFIKGTRKQNGGRKCAEAVQMNLRLGSCSTGFTESSILPGDPVSFCRDCASSLHQKPKGTPSQAGSAA